MKVDADDIPKSTNKWTKYDIPSIRFPRTRKSTVMAAKSGEESYQEQFVLSISCFLSYKIALVVIIRSNVKSMFIFFFDADGIVHKTVLLQDQTVIWMFWGDWAKSSGLNGLISDVITHGSHPWQCASRYVACCVAITRHSFPTPYSSDHAPCDFMFPKIKLKFNWRRFETIENIQTKS